MYQNFSWICVGAGVLSLAFFAPVQIAEASTFKVLHAFAGGTDGCYPGSGNLIMDRAGNLYGTTASELCGQTIYKLAPDGTETVLDYLPGGSGGDGPEALVMDNKGSLWGTACCGGAGGGVIFKISSNGNEKLVYTFAGRPNDGCVPYAAMVIDAKGKFYGTTVGCGRHDGGTIFKLAPDGTERLIHSFNVDRGGYFPFGGLVMDANGNLYGVNADGGRNDNGTLFKIAVDGTETLLHKFKGSPNDGSTPEGTLIIDQSGSLYGTARSGGVVGCEASQGCGDVFELAPDGTETVLHFFKGGKADGANPLGGVTADSAGNLYGTTQFGTGSNSCNGDVGCGAIFEIMPDGAESILHSFGDGSSGANPGVGLVADGKGDFYGTTQFGGTYGYGVVFEITP